MRLPGLPVSVRITDVPEEVEGGGHLPVSFEVRTTRAGTLTCEASLWCTLVTPVGGLTWPPESRLSAEVVKVAVEPSLVGPGEHRRDVELVVPSDARPTVATRVGKVRYEVNVVAAVDGHQGVANRGIRVRSTAAASWIERGQDGDGPWGLDVEVPTARPGGTLEGSVRVSAAEAPGQVAVSARLECFEEAGGSQVSRWRAEQVLDGALVLEAGDVAELPLRFELPDDAVPTVVMRTFAERWLLTVSVSDGTRERRLATGLAVVS